MIFPDRDHHLRTPAGGHGHGVTMDALVWRLVDRWLIAEQDAGDTR